jgi:hypothetical protein
MIASTRRATLGAILAAPLASVPAVANVSHAVETLPEREAEFLGLAPSILPLARAFNAASLEVHRLYEAANEAAGPYPGRDDKQAHRAWVSRGQAGRDSNGYHEA